MKHVFITLMLLVSSTRAQAACAEKFKEAGLIEIDQAVKNGWDNVRGIKLEELRNKIDSKEVEVNCLPKNFAARSGGRADASWHSSGDTKQIFINAHAENVPAKIKGMLSIHEHFGALGYDDDQGQISVPLDIMTDRSKGEPILQSLFPAKLKGKGTSTGVGGGGDGDELYIRKELFKRYEAEMKTLGLSSGETSARLARFLDVRIKYFKTNLRLVPAGIEFDEFRDLDSQTCRRGRIATVSVGVSSLTTDMGMTALYKEIKKLAVTPTAKVCSP